jgi:hypothetical protein
MNRITKMKKQYEKKIFTFTASCKELLINSQSSSSSSHTFSIASIQHSLSKEEADVIE